MDERLRQYLYNKSIEGHKKPEEVPPIPEKPYPEIRERLSTLMKTPIDTFDPPTTERINEILKEISDKLGEVNVPDQFINAKMILERNIHNIPKEEYKEIEKALGLKDENGKLTH